MGETGSGSQEGKPSLASESEDKYRRNLQEAVSLPSTPFRSWLKCHLIRQTCPSIYNILISTKTIYLSALYLTTSCLPVSCLLA